MDSLVDALIDFQVLLVQALTHLTALGVAFAGIGVLFSTTAPSFGYRLKRLGLQVIGACLIVICAHALLLEIYGAHVPAWLLITVYALFALMLLQGFLSLVFGASVGNSVISSLLSSLILWVLYIVIQPFRFIRDLLR